MRRRAAYLTISIFAFAFFEPFPVAAESGEFDGKWNGKVVVVDGDADSCLVDIKIISAIVKSGELKLELKNGEVIRNVIGKIDANGEFSEWHPLEMINRLGITVEQPVKFSGTFESDSFDGDFYSTVFPGYVCSGTIHFTRFGTAAHRDLANSTASTKSEQTAKLRPEEEADPVANEKLANPSTSKTTNKFDGIWQISLRGAGRNYSGCPLDTDLRLEVENGQASGSAYGLDYRVAVDALGRVTGEGSTADGVGTFEGSVEVDTGTGSISSDFCGYEVTAKRMKPIEPFAKRIEPAKPPASKIVKSPGTGRSIKARLQKLKTLLDKNLITEEKAAQKRREILKDL